MAKKQVILFAFLVLSACFNLADHNIWAVESPEEIEYQKGKALLDEGKLDEALNIFNNIKKGTAIDFKVKLAIIDTNIEQVRISKRNGDPTWKEKIYEPYLALNAIYQANKTSPDIYLSYAMCYVVNNRINKANKCIKKAFYYKPNYLKAYIVQGNVYLEAGRNKNKRILIKARKIFEKLLTQDNIDDRTKAMAHYKIGESYEHFMMRKIANEKRREHWNKVISLSPESLWAKRAKAGLSSHGL